MGEPLMNLPQWFLEREDSANSLVRYKEYFGDPVVGIMTLQNNKDRYIVCSDDFNIFSMSSLNLIEEYFQSNFSKEEDFSISFVYDKVEDRYISFGIKIKPATIQIEWDKK